MLLSERLGHTSIAVTIDRYSHVIPSIDKNAADVVAQLILSDPADRSDGDTVDRPYNS